MWSIQAETWWVFTVIMDVVHWLKDAVGRPVFPSYKQASEMSIAYHTIQVPERYRDVVGHMNIRVILLSGLSIYCSIISKFLTMPAGSFFVTSSEWTRSSLANMFFLIPFFLWIIASMDMFLCLSTFITWMKSTSATTSQSMLSAQGYQNRKNV